MLDIEQVSKQIQQCQNGTVKFRLLNVVPYLNFVLVHFIPTISAVHVVKYNEEHLLVLFTFSLVDAVFYGQGRGLGVFCNNNFQNPNTFFIKCMTCMIEMTLHWH